MSKDIKILTLANENVNIQSVIDKIKKLREDEWIDIKIGKNSGYNYEDLTRMRNVDRDVIDFIVKKLEANIENNIIEIKKLASE